MPMAEASFVMVLLIVTAKMKAMITMRMSSSTPPIALVRAHVVGREVDGGVGIARRVVLEIIFRHDRLRQQRAQKVVRQRLLRPSLSAGASAYCQA